MADQENSGKAPKDHELPGFKKDCLLAENRLLPLEPPSFGDFQVWVLERWNHASENGLFEPKDYINSGDVKEEELEDFLQRKVTLMIHSKWRSKIYRYTVNLGWTLNPLVLSSEDDCA